MIEHGEESASRNVDEQSKDEYFQQVADIANQMIDRHGKDFAMGTLVLAARFIAEGKPLQDVKSVEEATH